MAVLDRLLVNLGFVIETKEISKFQHSLNGVRKRMIEVGVAAIALGAGITELTKKFGENSEKIELNASRAGVTTTAYQELAGAASLAGINQDTFTQALQQFSFNIGQASIGTGAGVRAFGLLGISVRDANGQVKSISEILPQVAEKLKKLSGTQQISIAQQLGFTSSSVQFLLLGNKRIKELREQVRATGAVISEEGIKKGVLFSERMKLLGLNIKGVVEGIQEALVPSILKLVGGFEGWLKVNKKIVQQNLNKTFNAIAEALGFFVTVIGSLVNVLQIVAIPFGGLINLAELFFIAFGISKIKGAIVTVAKLGMEIKALAAAFIELDFVGNLSAVISSIGLLGKAFLTLDFTILPLTTIISLFAALAAVLFLVTDDVMGFASGKDSVLGRMIDKFPLLKKFVNGTIEVFKFFKDIINETIQSIENLTNILEGKNLLKSIKSEIQVVGGKFAGEGKTPGVSDGSSILSRFGLKTFDQEAAQKRLSSIGRAGISRNITNSSRINNGSSTTSNATTVNANINITDAGDSEQTARAVKKHVDNISRQAQRNLQSSVRS